MMRPLSVSKLPLGKLSGQSHCIKERLRKFVVETNVIFLGVSSATATVEEPVVVKLQD